MLDSRLHNGAVYLNKEHAITAIEYPGQTAHCLCKVQLFISSAKLVHNDAKSQSFYTYKEDSH